MKQQQRSNTVDSSDPSSNNEGKENHQDKTPDDSKASKYSKRLKKLKNRLIQTKNNIFNKKNKIPSDADMPDGVNISDTSFSDRSRHQSMPNLSKIELDDNAGGPDEIEYIDKHDLSDSFEDSCDEIDVNMKKLNTSKSFVDNVKSRLTKRKNGVSKKNLESTELPDVELGNELVGVASRKQSKRIKFF